MGENVKRSLLFYAREFLRLVERMLFTGFPSSFLGCASESGMTVVLPISWRQECFDYPKTSKLKRSAGTFQLGARYIPLR